MAVWQFECNIIPSKDKIENLNYNEIVSWRDMPRPICHVDFLERKKSWSSQIVQYGKTEETCIEFIFEKDTLVEIACRLDLRTLTKHDFYQLLKYVQSIDAWFWVENKMYLPKAEIMIELLKKSRANQYCINPIEYILTIDSSN